MDVESTLQIYAGMANGTVPPTDVDYVGQAVALLSSSTDWALISHHSQWVFRVNRAGFRSIFINDFRPHNQLPHDTVLQFLQRLGKDLEREYLDFIVNVSKAPEPRYHILLANLHLQHLLNQIGTISPDQLLKMEAILRGEAPPPNSPQNTPFSSVLRSRTNLFNLLKTSAHYDPNAVLVQIQNTPLREEKILIYKALKMHEKALAIIAGEQENMQRAEEYCASLVEKDSASEEQWANPTGANPLLLSLFNVCLNSPKEINDGIPLQAIGLLNRYPDQFDPVTILKLLPNNIPINLLDTFLNFSLKNTTHKMRNAQVVKSLTHSQLLKASLEKMTLEQQKVYITQNTRCDVTGQPVEHKDFVRYPNGMIMIMPQNGEVNLNVCGSRDFTKKPVLEPIG